MNTLYDHTYAKWRSMALQNLLGGIRELYVHSLAKEINLITSSDKELSVPKILLPEVSVVRLTSRDIEHYLTGTQVMENVQKSQNYQETLEDGKSLENDFNYLFGNDDDDTSPFLGFDDVVKSTAPVSSLAAKSNANLSTGDNQHSPFAATLPILSSSDRLTTSVSEVLASSNSQITPVTKKIWKSKQSSSETIKKNTKPFGNNKIYMRVKKNKRKAELVEKKEKSNSKTPILNNKRKTENVEQTVEITNIPSITQSSLGLVPQPSEQLPPYICDDFNVKLEDIKDEVDESDITIEHEVLDCPAYSVTERIITPSPRVLTQNSNHLLGSFLQINNNFSVPLENANDCAQSYSSSIGDNGYRRPHELKDLTTQLLELNNKNSDVEKKLAKLKQDYETKVAKLQAEKKGNEERIKKILQLLHNWRDGPEGGSSEMSTTSHLGVNRDCWHYGSNLYPSVVEDQNNIQHPLEFMPQVPAWYNGLNGMQVLPKSYSQMEETKVESAYDHNHHLSTEGLDKKWIKATVIGTWPFVEKGNVYQQNLKPNDLEMSLDNEHLDPEHVSGRGRVIKKLERLNL